MPKCSFACLFHLFADDWINCFQFSGARVEDYIYEKLDKRKDRMRLAEELGCDMIGAGKEFGSDTSYGMNLIKVGQAQQRLGQSEKEFVRSAYRGFIIPLRKFLEDVKTATVMYE